MLFLTYNVENNDKDQIHVLKMISIYLLSKYYSVEYFHTPLSSTKSIEVYNKLFYLKSTSSVNVFNTIIVQTSIDEPTILSLKNLGTITNILLKISNPFIILNSVPEIINELHHFHAIPELTWLETKVKTNIKVGMHIFRGSPSTTSILDESTLNDIILSNIPIEYYLNNMRILIEQCNEIYVPIEFHVYVENDKDSLDSIDGFNEFENVILHINTNPIDSFTELCNSDILIISSLSYLAGIVNRKAIVIYPTKLSYPPRSSWIVMDEPTTLEYNKKRMNAHISYIKEQCVKEQCSKKEKTTITYCSGGLLGDFIHQLSIVKEMYDKTLKKGILYISHQARPNEQFAFGLEKAYKDTYKLISSQSYIESYHIHKNEVCDINLSSWDTHQPLFISNWRSIFSNEYKVPWCTTPYFIFPYQDKYEKFVNRILISSSIKRFNNEINYTELLSQLPSKPLFITTTITEYEYFTYQTNLELDCLYFDDLYDFYMAIYHCKLFIGNLSSPLAFAQAAFKNRICLLAPSSMSWDNTHMQDLDTTWENCIYIYSNDLHKISGLCDKIFNYKSQFEQDKHVISVYNGKKNGYFVEIGAYNGIDSSNTYILEKDYNWNGICVECNPIHFKELCNVRACHKSNYAIYNVNDRVMTFYDSGGYAGLVETNNHSHVKNDPIINVTTKTLSTLLDDYKAPSFIEYLSLDTEGSEYEILKAHDFNRYKFGYICVEHNHIEVNRNAIRELLEKNGYEFTRENGNAQYGAVDDEYKLKNIEKYMTPILFLNHRKSQCGVYEYGVRLYDIWKKSEKYIFSYMEVGSLDEYKSINFSMYSIIIYNYHSATMTWLSHDTISSNMNIGILHECLPTFFNKCIDTQSDIPRPIYDCIPTELHTTNEKIKSFITCKTDNVPIIGSFGFGFTNKGFDKIVSYVNDQFSEAIIKLIISYATFGDKSGEIASHVSKLCNKIKLKPNIKLMIIHDYVNTNDLLYFLQSNTVNMFLYDNMEGRGISSTIDYALSVKTPIVISDSCMFRNIYDDSICIYKNSIDSCMKNSENYLQKYKLEYSHDHSIRFIESFLKSFLK